MSSALLKHACAQPRLRQRRCEQAVRVTFRWQDSASRAEVGHLHICPGRLRHARCSYAAESTAERVVSGLPQDLTDASSSQLDRVVVIGAGIAGLAIAAALSKVHIPALVLEQSSAPREEGGAIALWPNAFRALDALGIGDKIRQAHPLLSRIELCSSDGQQLREFSLDDCEGAPHEFRGVVRSELLAALRAAVPQENIRFGCPVASVRPTAEGAQIILEDGSSLHARLVVGADGTRSRVAPALNLPVANYAGYSAYRGVADVQAGSKLTPLDTVRQLFGQGVRAGLYPLSDSQWYWFVCWNCPKEAVSSEGEERREHALSLVHGWGEHAGIRSAIQHTPAEDITRSRVVDRWHLPGMGTSSELITLAGDAAHPMTPNLGQGGCVATEDAVVLAREIKRALANDGQGADSTTRSLIAAPKQALTDALRRFEKERSSRVLPITIRSWAMGTLLQIPLPPVCAARNAFISKGLPVKKFMEHTLYDCGSL